MLAEPLVDAEDRHAAYGGQHPDQGMKFLKLLMEEKRRITAGNPLHDQLEWERQLDRLSLLDTDPNGHTAVKEMLEHILVTQFGAPTPDSQEGGCTALPESAGEIILRIGVNDRLRKDGHQPLASKELRQLLAEAAPEANTPCGHEEDGLAAMGLRSSSYAMDRPGSPEEFCTFELQQGLKDTDKILIRFPTNTKVGQIRELLSEQLGEMGWGKADPLLLAPGTGDMLPCLLSASQVMALASGPDPESTPVDTLLLYQVLPPRWARDSGKVYQACEHCRSPNEAGEHSACLKAGLTETQIAGAGKPEVFRPGLSWQI
jgi:hypothetical protein